jgi:sterol desaturase/sphingolipid hydroxylase (fatty acid hydroxylase superfamily)
MLSIFEKVFEYSHVKNLVILPFVIHLIAYWVPSTIYGILDYYCLYNESFMLEYKLQGDQLSKNDLGTYLNAAKIALRNQGWFFLFLVLSSPICIWRGIDMTNELPSIMHMIVNGSVTYFMLSCLFYYIHRFLHLPYFYKKFHKMHHEWQAPIACSAIYGHPVEHILNNVLPIFIPSIILGLHPYELYVLITIATVHSVNVHSGYNFYICQAREHDDHHKYFICNYGAGLSWFDSFHKTRYIDLLKKKL